MATAFSWTPPRGAGLVVPKPNEMEQGRNDWGRRSVLEQFCHRFGTSLEQNQPFQRHFSVVSRGKGSRPWVFGAGDGNRTHVRHLLTY